MTLTYRSIRNTPFITLGMIGYNEIFFNGTSVLVTSLVIVIMLLFLVAIHYFMECWVDDQDIGTLDTMFIFVLVYGVSFVAIPLVYDAYYSLDTSTPCFMVIHFVSVIFYIKKYMGG